jgi:hypothetical protein
LTLTIPYRFQQEVRNGAYCPNLGSDVRETEECGKCKVVRMKVEQNREGEWMFWGYAHDGREDGFAKSIVRIPELMKLA